MPQAGFIEFMTWMSGLNLTVEINTQSLVGVADAFAAHFQRFLQLSNFTPKTVVAARVWESSVRKALRKVMGDENATALRPDQEAQVESEARRIYAEDFPRFALGTGDYFRYGPSFVDECCSSYPQAYGGAQALFASVVIGTWTAFESMTGDLWVKAVNQSPSILGKLSGRKKVPQEVSEHEKSRNPKEVKTVSLDDLARYGFSVRDKMGELLLPKFNFTTLAGITSAYLNAFSVDYDEIDKIINDKSIYMVCKVRNLLVHDAGVVTKRFLDETASVRVGIPEFSDLQDRTPLPINGSITAKLIDPAFRQSMALIEAVDRWLLKHPEPPQ